jgi:plasmid recombination enzyme
MTVRKEVIGGVTMAVTHLSISCAKSKNVSKQQQHHTERFNADRKHRNKMIDPEKSDQNINLRPDLQGSYQERFDSIVNSDRYKGRRKKDGTPVIAENGKNAAVKMVQVTVNIGRADENGKKLDDLTDDEITELLKNDVYPMMKDWFGGDANVIGAAIHRDESKPHLHLDIVPLTEDGKLSAKKMLGNENNMRFHQKEWLESMQERRPDLNFQRKQNQKSNGVEMEKLKELTAQAEEHGNDVALNVLMQMRKQDEVELNKKRERIAEDEQKNDAFKDKLDATVVSLKKTAVKLVEQEHAQNKREREQNERETALNGRERTLKGRENMLNERERNIEERVNTAFKEREGELKGRENTLNEREHRIEERVKGLDDEVETRVAKIKHAVVGAFKQLPKIKDTLMMYVKKAREKDEEERKAREEQAERLAEITDAKTEQLADAIEQEDIKQVEQHTEHLEQINKTANEIDESQFDMSAGTLENKIDNLEFEIDESQFDMSTQNQRTQ